MSKIIDIPEGRTNDYLIHGVFVVIAAGILMLAHWSVAILTAALAVALFLASSGVEIDVKGRRARIYKALGRLRSGQWVSTERYTGIAIHHTRESQVMTSRASQTTVRVRTYDVRLTTAGGEAVLFHDFTDYAKARKCAVAMAEGWKLELTDEVQERRQRAQGRIR
ncbi:MAG: hypothetical protein IPJ76_10285 [Flavobacteriales bacterium]|nr:MAG: hypothetical protein IPJ76_10285 [Flavobacteriales bacterium]